MGCIFDKPSDIDAFLRLVECIKRAESTDVLYDSSGVWYISSDFTLQERKTTNTHFIHIKNIGKVYFSYEKVLCEIKASLVDLALLKFK